MDSAVVAGSVLALALLEITHPVANAESDSQVGVGEGSSKFGNDDDGEQQRHVTECTPARMDESPVARRAELPAITYDSDL